MKGLKDDGEALNGDFNSVETAQPGDRTTYPGIVMPWCYESGQRVDSLARVVITPVRHTHTRLLDGEALNGDWKLLHDDDRVFKGNEKVLQGD